MSYKLEEGRRRLRSRDRGGWLRYSFVALLVAVAVGAAASAQSSCLNCHATLDDQAVAHGDIGDAHLEEYRGSMHSRAGVHCQDCHSGDPESFNMFQAHRGVLNSRHPSSSTHTRRIPATCGRCHGPIYDAFRGHEHFTLLQLGDSRAPSCTTCHGSAASRPLTPRPVGCSQCHNTQADGMAAPLGSRGPELLSAMQDVGVVRRKVETRIARLRDAARKHDAEGTFFEADVAWQTAIEAGHGFAWDEWEALIQQSRVELEALLASLRKR